MVFNNVMVFYLPPLTLLVHSSTRFITELLALYDKVVFLGPGASRENEEWLLMVVLKILRCIWIDNTWVTQCRKRGISETFLIKSEPLNFLYLFFSQKYQQFCPVWYKMIRKAPFFNRKNSFPRTMTCVSPGNSGVKAEMTEILQIQENVWPSALLRMRTLPNSVHEEIK